MILSFKTVPGKDMCMCMCVCVCERERKRLKERDEGQTLSKSIRKAL